MNITSLRVWHWMTLGVLAGAVYGYVREASANFYDELGSYGTRRIGQREFESALTKQLNGKPRFSDIVIFPHRLSGTGAQTITVHIVSGMYWDGRTQVENGRTAAKWEPAYFVASVPYFPTPASPAALAGQQFADVMAY